MELFFGNGGSCLEYFCLFLLCFVVVVLVLVLLWFWGGFLFVLLLLFVCGIFLCLFFICFLITKRMVEVSVQVFIEVLPVFFSLCSVCVYELETSQLKILSWPGHKSKLFNSWHSFGPGQAVLSCRKIRYSWDVAQESTIVKMFVPIYFNRANLFCRGRDYRFMGEIISILFGLRAKESCHSCFARVSLLLISPKP